MLRSRLLYDVLQTLPTAQFFIITSTLSGSLLLARRVKPVASCILALSIPGTIGVALSFLLFAVHFTSIQSVINIRSSLTTALIASLAFPSHLIAPLVFFASVMRYRSNKADYAVGLGVLIVTCLLLIAAALSHGLATWRNPDP